MASQEAFLSFEVTCIEAFVEEIHWHKEYLQQQTVAVQAAHRQNEPRQCIDSNASMYTVQVSSGCDEE